MWLHWQRHKRAWPISSWHCSVFKSQFCFYFLNSKKMYPIQQAIWLLLPLVADAATVSYTIPTTAPSGAAALDPAPVGISLVSLLLTDFQF